MCPSGLFFNMSFSKISDDKKGADALKQTLGLVLGLCRNAKREEIALYCENQSCLMSKSPGFLPEFGLLHGSGVENLLCADCRKDLEALKSKESDPKLSFEGPFLIRREDGYSVASLPFCDIVIPTPVENTFDWEDLLSFVKVMARRDIEAAVNIIEKERKRRHYIDWYLRGFWFGPCYSEAPSLSPTNYAFDLLKKVADDPSQPVKRHAKSLLKKLEKEQKKQ
jgi:hypothetical protein